ncbi:archaetidylserine decarboxylase [Alkalicoccus daliensis]|uniref:phosphatidylserine decarboxylase n=1 Tax=Alkalicoccus daliensis TaxID=745820 RepID=A0A1H0BGS3_9BACI|nr:archaetidylserine decarboxylase [Alkalicoccus daliensis]SDN44874.1 phosphatidylserine decarboxylase [Alkalicoccus daliensis]
MKKKTYQLLMDLTHNPLYASVLKRSVESRLSRWIVPSFAKTFKINEEEAEKQINDFYSLQDFFTRHLKEGSRPVSMLEKAVVSPVDGSMTAAGEISPAQTFEVKGMIHDLHTLLRRPDKITRYAGGSYGIFYLSPREYHRIHAPVSGKVISRWALGEFSEPVNDLAFQFGVQPLSSNYRLITEIQTETGKVAVVKIGALNVNSVHYAHLHDEMQKGEEFAYFGFGSTVILLFEPGMIKWTKEQGSVLKQGEAFCFLKK